jgi:hypothetical protein
MNKINEVSFVQLDLVPDINGDISIRDNDGKIIVKVPKSNSHKETIKKANLIYDIYFKSDFFIYNDGYGKVTCVNGQYKQIY